MSVEAAKEHMARGHSLKAAASRIGMTPEELDLALWNALPEAWEGSYGRSEETRRMYSRRMKAIMADPAKRVHMMRGLGRKRRRTTREILASVHGLTEAEIAEVRHLNRSKRLLIEDAIQVVLRSRRPA